jgi:hypothetical protein
MYNITDIRTQLASSVPIAEVQRTSGLMQKTRMEAKTRREGGQEAPYDPAKAILDRIKKYQDSSTLGTPLLNEGTDTQTISVAARPRSRDEGGDSLKISDQASGLTSDEAFNSKLAEMEQKYPGLTRSELFRVIKGESAFNPKAKNSSGASGLFQFMPAVAEELGTTTDAILRMEPAKQLELYDQYLSKWGYKGQVSLGVMQAAPAFANASPNTVIYKKGSKAWEQNPGWRPAEGGDITVASIDAYYRRQ